MSGWPAARPCVQSHRVREQQVGVPAERAAVVLLVGHHDEVRVRVSPRPRRRTPWLPRADSREPRRGPPPLDDRIDLTDDGDAERFEHLEIGNLCVEAAGGEQPLSQIHVVVMVLSPDSRVEHLQRSPWVSAST